MPKISSWVDPISDYEFKDTDGDGVMEITTMQRVIGISHPDTLVFEIEGGRYIAAARVRQTLAAFSVQSKT